MAVNDSSGSEEFQAGGSSDAVGDELPELATTGQDASNGEDIVKRMDAELTEMKDKYLRALAELENVKKRSLKERSELLKYQGERMVVDLLDIIDNFELALKAPSGESEQFRKGVELIYKLFQDLLTKWEVRGESAIDKPFDPERHNAISRLKVDGKEPGTVIQELRKAYSYKDKLVRYAEVVVAAE